MQYVVKEGDHLSAIAESRGFLETTLWEHPENEDLVELRQNPHLLQPGDGLFIPEKTVREEEAATEQRHVFRVRKKPLFVYLEVLDRAYESIEELECGLRIGKALATSEDGRLELQIPPTVKEGVLTLGTSKTSIRIGHLNPITELSGQIGRLNNLGYDAGDVAAEIGPRFYGAVEEFQCDQDLDVDGICGPKTLAKLEEVHGC